MNTQLNVATTVNMDALNLLAMEFKQAIRALGRGDSRAARRAGASCSTGTGRTPIPSRIGRTAGWARPSPSSPCEEAITIASTDSSCILLGETSDGAVYAVRAAVCFASARGWCRATSA